MQVHGNKTQQMLNKTGDDERVCVLRILSMKDTTFVFFDL
jgi:hypothetical protein